MCACACGRGRTHTHIYIYTYTHTHTGMGAHTHTRVYTYMCIYPTHSVTFCLPYLEIVGIVLFSFCELHIGDKFQHLLYQ